MPHAEQPVLFPPTRSPKCEPLVQPFLKWAGGKRQLLPALRPLFPKYKRYYEPFLGGGAVLFDQQPTTAFVNDFNSELINCYLTIRDHPEELLIEAAKHPNTSEHFYQVREMDRSPNFELMTSVQRAARIIFLNKTCFNGLFRVNSQGQFNVPFGDYKKPAIADPAIIRAISRYLNKAKVTFRNEDFAEAVADTKQGDFVYFDPPYDPVTDPASFTGYTLDGFNREEQRRLKELCDTLTARSVKLIVSNSDTPFIRDLYTDDRYTIQNVQARRAINSVASGRGKIGEVFVLNYTP